MRGAGDQFSVGERIAFYRRRRGMTQRVLANLVGRSEDWLSKVERNERDVRRLDIVGELAKASGSASATSWAIPSWSRRTVPRKTTCRQSGTR